MIKRNNEDNYQKYLRLSHELAKKQAIERFAFEIDANANIFKKQDELSLDELINDFHNVEMFTKKEFEEIYNMSKLLK